MADSSQKKRNGDPILRRIDGIRRTVTLWTLAWGYLWVVLLVAVLVFGGVLADHAFVLQKWGRLAFFRAFLLSLAAAALAATLFPMLRRVSRIYIARRMEQQRPELRNSLISYLQCRESPAIPAEVKGLMARRAAGHIGSLDAAVAVDHTGYLRLAAAVGTIVAAFLLYWAFSPKSATLSLERLFRPRADIRPPTATQLYDVKPGELYVLKGGQPELSASVRGVHPPSVYAVWDGATFSGRRILLSQKDRDGWQGAFPPVLEDGGYYLAAGDTRTDRFGIHVVPRPAVDRVRLDISPPAYTGMPTRTVENADAEAPAGSRVKVQVATSIPPARGYMDFGNGLRTYLDPVPGRQVLAGELTVLDSGTYEVRFESTAYPDGSTFSNDAPVAYRLTCIPDSAPTATLSAPEDGVSAAPRDTVQLTYSAADDYGVSRLRLLYSTSGLAMQSVDIAQPGVQEVKNAHYAWDLASTAAVPGQTITYRLEAEDNHHGRAQTGQSETRRIVITGPQAAPPEAPAAPQHTDTGGTQKPPEAGQPAQQNPPPAGQEPSAALQAAPQKPPAEGHNENPFQKYSDYVRSIYDALGMQPPGERTASGGQGQAAEVQQAPAATTPPQQGPEAGQQATSGQQTQEGGRPAEGAAGQASEGQTGRTAGGQQTPGGAQERPAADQTGLQGAQGATGQAGGQEAQSQGATGQAGAHQQGNQGAQSAAGQAQAGGAREGGQGSAAQQGGQQAGGPGAQQTSGQGGGSEAGTQAAAGQDGRPGGGEQGSAAGQSGGRATGVGAAGQQGSQGATGAGQSAGAAQGSTGGASAPGRQSAPGSAAVTQGAPSPGTPGAQGGGSGVSGHGIQSLPPIPAPPPHTLPPLKDLDAAVNNLSQMLDEDRIPEHVYRDLGMNRQKLREFIDEYRHRRAEMGQQPSEQAPAQLSEDAGRLLRGASAVGSGVRVQDTRPKESTPDTLHSRFEGADRLSSRYRDLVNQYYKALSEEQ